MDSDGISTIIKLSSRNGTCTFFLHFPPLLPQTLIYKARLSFSVAPSSACQHPANQPPVASFHLEPGGNLLFAVEKLIQRGGGWWENFLFSSAAARPWSHTPSAGTRAGSPASSAWPTWTCAPPSPYRWVSCVCFVTTWRQSPIFISPVFLKTKGKRH